MNIDNNKQPATYLKSKQGQNSSMKKTKKNWQMIAMILGLLIFIGGAISVFLISQKQDTTPVAPTAPQSQPSAYIEKTQTCTLEFEVSEITDPKVACGRICASTSQCEMIDGKQLECVLEESSRSGHCAFPEFAEACASNPGEDTCCYAPEENLFTCGESGCTNSDDCEDGYVCVSTSETDDENNIVKYCANEDYLDACVDSPSEANCCEAQVTVTPTTTVTPTVTVTPTTTVTPTVTVTPTTTVTQTTTPTGSVTTVITTVGCNESCNANADCSNISHICYDGQCRLDVNPTDAQCKLSNGETTIVRPIEVPTESGPANWINYIKVGLGTLGIGALLLLLL